MRADISSSIAKVRNDKPLRRSITNAGWLFSANTVALLVGFGQGVLVARAIGVDHYGVLGLIIVYVSVVNRLVSFRVNEFVVRYVTEAVSNRDYVAAAASARLALGLETASSVVAYAAVWASAPYAAALFVKSGNSADAIRAYSLVVLVNITVESASGILQAFGQFPRIALVSSVGQMATLCGVIVAVLQDAQIASILASYLIGQAVRAVALYVLAAYELGSRLGSDWWRAPLGTLSGQTRGMMRFLLSTNLSGTLGLIGKDSDVLWLGYLRGPTEVGYFRLALYLATLAFAPIQPLVQTIYPELTREVTRGRWTYVSSLLRRISLVSALWSLPVGVIMGTAGFVLLPVVYGPEFAPAGSALVWLLPGLACANILFWTRPALLSLSLPHYAVRVGLVVALIKVICVLTLVARCGYVANAMVLSILYCLGVGISARKVTTLLRQREAMAS